MFVYDQPTEPFGDALVVACPWSYRMEQDGFDYDSWAESPYFDVQVEQPRLTGRSIQTFTTFDVMQEPAVKGSVEVWEGCFGVPISSEGRRGQWLVTLGIDRIDQDRPGLSAFSDRQGFGSNTVVVDFSPVPEPTCLTLATAGFLAMFAFRGAKSIASSPRQTETAPGFLWLV